MTDGLAQIYVPAVGRTYRIHSGEHIFLGRVTATDDETVTVEPCKPQEGIKSIRLKRLHTKFESWL